MLATIVQYHEVLVTGVGLSTADFKLFDEYEWRSAEQPPFSFPMFAFWGGRDRRVTQQLMQVGAQTPAPVVTQGPCKTVLNIASTMLHPLGRKVWHTACVMVSDDDTLCTALMLHSSTYSLSNTHVLYAGLAPLHHRLL